MAIMNSKQRRKDRRYWSYRVRLTYDQVEQNDYDLMFDWCRDTFGHTVECGWREQHRHRGTCWHFDTEEKAILFALRWL